MDTIGKERNSEVLKSCWSLWLKYGNSSSKGLTYFQFVETYHQAAVQQAVSAASLGGASGYASGAASGAASANGSASPETSPSKVKEKDS